MQKLIEVKLIKSSNMKIKMSFHSLLNCLVLFMPFYLTSAQTRGVSDNTAAAPEKKGEILTTHGSLITVAGVKTNITITHKLSTTMNLVYVSSTESTYHLSPAELIKQSIPEVSKSFLSAEGDISAIVSSKGNEQYNHSTSLPHKLTFIASINKKIAETTKDIAARVLCIGILESPIHVLTTASCANSHPKEKMEVTFGSGQSIEADIVRQVIDVTSHPLYDVRKFSSSIYNLAWLTLNETVTYGSDILTAPHSNINTSLDLIKMISDNHVCMVAGFSPVGIFQHTGMKLLPLQSCKTDQEDLKSNTHICAINVNKTDCFNMEGAPLICKGKVTGLITHTLKKSNCEGLPNIFTLIIKDELPPYSNVTKYTLSIDKILPNNVESLCQIFRVRTLNNPCPKDCSTN